jgi:hypothetical protein
MKRVFTGLAVAVLFGVFTTIAYQQMPEPDSGSTEKGYSGQRHAGISIERVVEVSPTVAASP